MEQLKFIFNKYKNILAEVVIVIIICIGAYYGYSLFQNNDGETTTTEANGQLLGPAFVSFLQITGKNGVNLDTSFMKNPLIGQLQDFTEEINPSPKKGRVYPFYPYDSSRPIR